MECATPPVETPMFERSIRFWCVCGSSARQSPPQRRPMRCEHLDGRLIVQIVCDEISVHEEYPTFSLTDDRSGACAATETAFLHDIIGNLGPDP